VEQELGDRLRMVRARHWVLAAEGDPYALLLRDLADDPRQHYAALRERGAVRRSRLGTWVVADAEVGAAVLGDPRFGARRADGGEPAQHVLGLAEVFPADPAPATLSTSDVEALAVPVADRLVAALTGEFDLLADVAHPLATTVLAQAYDLEATALAGCLPGLATALDARLCPQRLDDAMTLLSAVDTLGKLVADPAVVPLAAATEPAAALLASTVLALLDRWDQFRAEPGRAAVEVERTLRRVPPARLLSRVAGEDVDLSGEHVAAGDQVVVLADSEDTQLAFAHPLDHAAAAPLVLGLVTAALRALATHAPQLRLAGPPVPRRRSPVVRGLHRLPVTV